MFAKTLAEVHALLSITGPNKRNYFPISYDGKHAGGRCSSWLPVAELPNYL